MPNASIASRGKNWFFEHSFCRTKQRTHYNRHSTGTVFNCASRILQRRRPILELIITTTLYSCRKNKKLVHTRLPSVGFRSWSRFLAVSLQVTWVINPTVGCHYFPPGPQLRSQPLRGRLPILLLGEQRHDGCEQFAQDCYPTASRLRFGSGSFLRPSPAR